MVSCEKNDHVRLYGNALLLVLLKKKKKMLVVFVEYLETTKVSGKPNHIGLRLYCL